MGEGREAEAGGVQRRSERAREREGRSVQNPHAVTLISTRDQRKNDLYSIMLCEEEDIFVLKILNDREAQGAGQFATK